MDQAIKSRRPKGADLTGERYGKLTVVREADKIIGKHRRWVCECDCGNVVSVLQCNLGSNKVNSCGCLRVAAAAERRHDLTGKTFDRLTVIEEALRVHGRRRWRCKCKCGKVTIVEQNNLTSGHTTSCGCFRKERIEESGRIDARGKEFGKLTAIRFIKTDKHGHAMWLFRCLCGRELVAILDNVMRGNTTSCGCNVELSRIAAIERVSKNVRPFEARFNLCRVGAKKRAYEFSLTLDEYVDNFVGRACHYCGEDLPWNDRNYRSEDRSFRKSNGSHLDRKDNSKGYSLDNCVPCCGDCNRTKGPHVTYSLMIEFGKSIRAAGGWEKIKSEKSVSALLTSET